MVGVASLWPQTLRADAISEPVPPSPFKTRLPLHPMGKVGNGNEETPGEWYIGETPDNLVPDSPVLLFVPGLNNTAQIFWEDNDMYQTAYNAGYQTAFIQLYDAGGESANMWDNGRLLADKIQEIANHFRKDVTIIAFSKGGVDAQTALTYYGASTYVDNVITLSSPHHGSQLADLAYSAGAGWLAELIGAQGEGTYSLQTANMENFRTETDAHPNAYLNDYFTLGGTNWGTMFTPNWFGGIYLSGFGDNDGVVTTTSSNLPGGQELQIGDWSHTTIRTGVTLPHFIDYVAGDHPFDSTQHHDRNTPINRSLPNHWINGGKLNNKKIVSINIEEHVEKLYLHILTAEQLSYIEITDSVGKPLEKKVEEISVNGGIFQGAVSYRLIIESPQPGKWQLEMSSPSNKENAYLLVANFNSEHYIDQSIQLDKHNYVLQLDNRKLQEDRIIATYYLSEAGKPETEKKWTVKGKPNLSQKLPFKKTNTVYNLTIDIEGVTKKGNPFNRTIIDSIFVD